MPVSTKPSSSSACRMAPTRPSIMSEGATRSAPARACTTDMRASTSTVSSLRIRPSSPTSPSCPWSVNGSRATSRDHDKIRQCRLEGRARHEAQDLRDRGRHDHPPSSRSPEAPGRGPRRESPGARQIRASSTRRSIEKRKHPGIAPMGIGHSDAIAHEARHHEVGGGKARLADHGRRSGERRLRRGRCNNSCMDGKLPSIQSPTPVHRTRFHTRTPRQGENSSQETSFSLPIDN